MEIAGKEPIQGLIGFGYSTSGNLAPEGLKKFKSDYTKKYGEWAAHSMVTGVPISAVFLAIEEAGSLDSDKIVSILESGKKWETPFGVKGAFGGAETYGRPHQWLANQYVLEVQGEKSVTISEIPMEDLLHGWQ